jgi:hypothetical protein
VRRDLRRAGRLLVLPTLALLAVLAFVPGRTELAIRVYALVFCGIALALMVAALRRAYPRTTPLRPRRTRSGRTSRDAPAMLARLEQEVALGAAGSFDLHHHLRPRLRTIAAELLTARRRISLDGDRLEARALLGEEAWELVRKDRSPPEDRLARGAAPDVLDRVVASLERL